jgi:hypothetical protein
LLAHLRTSWLLQGVVAVVQTMAVAVVLVVIALAQELAVVGHLPSQN